jgi:hypothetical protein
MEAVSGLGREYFPAMVEERLFPRESNLIYHQRWLFEGVDFAGKTMLDIGGSAGLNGFYAACNGARDVLCVNPGRDGGTSGASQKFSRLKRRLGLDNIHLEPALFQSFEARGRSFDVVLLQDCVNHLDENACIYLLADPEARARYRRIFQKIAALANPGATLILCDCSRHNFFAALGLRNPVMPTVEWEKHQPPEVWAALLAQVGFVNPRIRWSSFNRLGSAGELLLGNRFAAYFLKSHFCLSMHKRHSA